LASWASEEEAVRIVVGIDWSDESFATVQQVLQLYRPTEIDLVHGNDLGIFKYPGLVQAANLPGYEQYLYAVTDAGQQVLDRTAGIVSDHTGVIHKVNEIGSPAEIILDTARKRNADLVAVGARGRNQVTEIVLGSVSHRVLTHASCPTLIVKGNDRPIQQVLVAIEGAEDAGRITQWLRTHPFNKPVALTVLSVVPSLEMVGSANIIEFQAWCDAAKRYAEDLVKETGAGLMSPNYKVSTQIVTGVPAAKIAEQAKTMDLVVVGSHSRRGVERFLLGSVSHSVVHRVACSILVVR
jgi:nucleotide-binding universal stress UspA family protein